MRLLTSGSWLWMSIENPKLLDGKLWIGALGDGLNGGCWLPQATEWGSPGSLLNGAATISAADSPFASCSLSEPKSDFVVRAKVTNHPLT
jgi:hypothetical protein